MHADNYKTTLALVFFTLIFIAIPGTAKAREGFRNNQPNKSQTSLANFAKDAATYLEITEPFSYPQPSDPFEMPAYQISGENISTILPLAHWHEGEIGGIIENWFFDGSGSLMGVNTSNGIYLINLTTDTVTHLLPSQPYQHRLKAISPDGKFFVTQTNESERMWAQQGIQWQEELYLWDVSQQSIITQLDVESVVESIFPKLDVYAMTFSPDGSKITALINVYDNSGDSLKSFVWNMPDGQLASSQSAADERIRELLSQKYLSYSEVGISGETFSGFESRFLPEGDQIAILLRIDPYSNIGYESLVILSFPEGDLISEIPFELYPSVRLSANGDAFVTIEEKGIFDREFSRWGLPDGNLISTITFTSTNNQSPLTFSDPDNYTISPSGDLISGISANSGNVAIVNSDGVLVRETSAKGNPLAFSPRGDYLVVQNKGDLVFVDTSTGEVSKSFRISQTTGGLAVHPTEDWMAISHSTTIDIYEISTRTLVISLTLGDEIDEPPPSLSFSADGEYLISQQLVGARYSSSAGGVTYDGAEIRVWNTSNWSVVSTWINDGEDWNRGNKAPELFQPLSLLITSYYGQLSFFDINGSINAETGFSEPEFVADNTYDVANFKLSPDQKYLAYYGSYQDTPQFALFDLSNVSNPADLQSALSSPVLSYPVDFVGSNAFSSIAFSQQSDLLAVYQINLSIYVFDLQTLEIKWKINDTYSRNKLAFSADSKLLFADGPVYDMNGYPNTFVIDDPLALPDVGGVLPIGGDFTGVYHDGTLFVSVSKGGVITYWGVTDAPAQVTEPAADDSAYRDTGPLVSYLTTHIPTPGEVSTKIEDLLANLSFAAFLMLPFAIAVDVFSRMFSNNDESLSKFAPVVMISGIQKKIASFTIGKLKSQQVKNFLKLLSIAGFYGLVFSLLDPRWNPISTQGVSLFISMVIAFGLVGLLDDILQWRAIRKWGVGGEFSVRPTNVFLALASTTVSRILSLLPGLMFGSPEAIKVDEASLSDQQKRHLMRISMFTYLGVGLLAWLPTEFMDAQPDTILAGLQATLLVIYAAALENMFVQLLGHSDGLGKRMRAWNKWVWAVVLSACAFWFLHTLLNPTNGFMKDLQQGNVPLFIEVTFVFIGITFLLNLYLRYRQSKNTKTNPA